MLPGARAVQTHAFLDAVLLTGAHRTQHRIAAQWVAEHDRHQFAALVPPGDHLRVKDEVFGGRGGVRARARAVIRVARNLAGLFGHAGAAALEVRSILEQASEAARGGAARFWRHRGDWRALGGERPDRMIREKRCGCKPLARMARMTRVARNFASCSPCCYLNRCRSVNPETEKVLVSGFSVRGRIGENGYAREA